MNDLELAASTSVSVLIVADSPERRSHAARWIHAQSAWRDGPLITLCAAHISSSDVTEAFARARGGTLFVDAIDQLRPWAQRRLLRLLDAQASAVATRAERWYGRRVIAGADPALHGAVAAHYVSERLFYRVNVIRIDASGWAQESPGSWAEK